MAATIAAGTARCPSSTAGDRAPSRSSRCSPTSTRSSPPGPATSASPTPTSSTARPTPSPSPGGSTPGTRIVSFDATIKVSHLLRHRDVVAELATLGLAFVVSAFESTSDTVLRRLGKGHTAADASRAVAELRAHGVEIRPSFLPFTPWTSRQDVVDIVDFVAAHDLVANVDPVQYSIRLLIPPGSLLLAERDPVLARCLGDLDAASLGHGWSADDPVLDELQAALAARVEAAADVGRAGRGDLRRGARRRLRPPRPA